MGAPAIIAARDLGSRQALLATMMQTAWGAMWLGKLAAVLVMVTAFASVFSLLLGYSRIPFAAARDGNFPAVFGKLHATRGVPCVSLLVLAGMACMFCFFSLGDVIAALVVLRICLQFGLQHVGVMVLRKRKPEMPRPFRLWLYPLPPILALAGFTYIVVSRPNFARELILAALVAAVGTAVFVARQVQKAKGQQSDNEITSGEGVGT
jgi:amino acid transporter